MAEKKLMLTKAGLVKCPHLDFSDDGTRFIGYMIDDIEVSYAKRNGEVYLSANVGKLINSLIAKHDEELYKLYNKVLATFHEYNGVSASYISTEDVARWVEDVRYFADVCKKTQMPKPIAYLNTIDNCYYAWTFDKNWNGWVTKSFDKIRGVSDGQILSNFKIMNLVPVVDEFVECLQKQ